MLTKDNFCGYEEIEIERVELIAEHLMAQCDVAKMFASPGKIRMQDLAYSMDRLSIMLTQTVAKQVLTERFDKTIRVDVPYSVTFEVPATWFQSFKAQYFPSWLLNKYPVQHRRLTKDGKKSVDIPIEVENTADVYFPKVAIPDQEHYIHVRKPVVRDLFNMR